jgi:hypothetical protein
MCLHVPTPACIQDASGSMAERGQQMPGAAAQAAGEQEHGRELSLAATPQATEARVQHNRQVAHCQEWLSGAEVALR